MSDIRDIERQVRVSYAGSIGSGVETPLELLAVQWTVMAEMYAEAASVLEGRGAASWLPRLQLTGHAIECALKACIAANGVCPDASHDLVTLYERAATVGCRVDQQGMAMIVHASHFYFRDLATGTKFKARYPAKEMESLGGAVPEDAMFQAVVRSLVGQAKQKRPW